MVTARHNGHGNIVLRRRAVRGEHHAGGPLEWIDRPLRFAAGGDAILLRIYRVSAAGAAAAAVGAIAASAVW